MGIIKGFTFDGVNSLDYNIGITGSAVYNAPTRNVEMISIPGRDGEYALDHGRFNNIEITYPAGMYDTAQTDLATRISELRNQLASRVGYKRLEDEYNPDEYRMAIYKSGLEVSPVQYGRAGQFDIIFDCKPQRFLKSGETPVSVASGDTLTNPTLFDAKPLIKFNSSGTDGSITIGDRNIGVLSALLGVVPLDLNAYALTRTNPTSLVIIKNKVYNAGDPFTLKGGRVIFTLNYRPVSVEFLNANGLTAVRNQNDLTFSASDVTFTAGTPQTITQTIDVYILGSTQPRLEETKTFSVDIEYNGGDQIQYRWTPGDYSFGGYSRKINASTFTGTVNSSKNTLEDVDIYIDLDIGEAYRIENGSVVSINNFVNLGGELPALPPGNTTITYDNTISNFKITPRWWKI